MPYSSEHRAASRERIVASARALFNRHGFEQVSIDQIMQSAGMTRGGFYHHFSNKDQLYAEAVASFTTCNPFASQMAAIPEPQRLARQLLELYLSDEVLENLDFQCPLYALPGDVARAGLKPQQAYTDLMRNLAQVFLRALEGEDMMEREQRAHAIVALCVGGMVLARTTNDPALRKSLRAAARAQALALLGD
jgi:AcrR family transcriptional regulator